MLAGPVAQRARYVNFLKAQGLKPGVSDIVIALPRGPFHGAYMELKREAGSRTSDAQEDWVALMNAVGYRSAIVKGYEEARQFAQDYLKCA